MDLSNEQRARGLFDLLMRAAGHLDPRDAEACHGIVLGCLACAHREMVGAIEATIAAEQDRIERSN